MLCILFRVLQKSTKNVLFKKRSPFQKKFYAHIWTFILWSVTLKCLVSDTFASVTLLAVLELQIMKSQNAQNMNKILERFLPWKIIQTRYIFTQSNIFKYLVYMMLQGRNISNISFIFWAMRQLHMGIHFEI